MSARVCPNKCQAPEAHPATPPRRRLTAPLPPTGVRAHVQPQQLDDDLAGGVGETALSLGVGAEKVSRQWSRQGSAGRSAGQMSRCHGRPFLGTRVHQCTEPTCLHNEVMVAACVRCCCHVRSDLSSRGRRGARWQPVPVPVKHRPPQQPGLLIDTAHPSPECPCLPLPRPRPLHPPRGRARCQPAARAPQPPAPGLCVGGVGF